jgi:LacI family transcriptional regulator
MIARMSPRNGRSATLRQVAAAAGVHLSTVSRALDPERRNLISRDIVARVEGIAKELGWHPNLAAASLRRGRSKAIGVLIPDLLNMITAQIVQGVESSIVPRGYFPLVVSTHAAASSNAIVERLLWQRVDGVIVATTDDEFVPAALAKAGITVVLTSRADPEGQFSSVSGDRESAANLAVDHLHALGHRDIAILSLPKRSPSGAQRLKYMQQALKRRGLKEVAIAEADEVSRDAGLRAFAALLAQRAPKGACTFTAVCAANDLLALGAYEAMRQAGLSIPRDVSVVGQNDMLMVDMVSPPLTTVSLQHYQIGRQAGELLIDEIEAREANGGTPRPRSAIVFRPELVPRASTAAPAVMAIAAPARRRVAASKV